MHFNWNAKYYQLFCLHFFFALEIGLKRTTTMDPKTTTISEYQTNEIKMFNNDQ